MNLSAFQTTALIILAILILGSLAITLCCLVRPKNQTFRKVAVIIRSWWIIAGSFLVALSWYPWGVAILMYIVSLFAIREYLKVSRVPHKRYLRWALIFLCTVQYVVLYFHSLPLFYSIIPVLCLWLVPGLVIFSASIAEIELVTSVGIGLALVLYYISHIAALSLTPDLHFTPDHATFAILTLILITWCNDIFQFLSGKAVGKRKIVPNVSPNKTLGGFIGGIIGTTILSCVCGLWFLELTVPQSVGLGILLGITGMFGDLFFSAVKRKIGVKDFSSALPGHGGLLDRLDSLIFTAPIYFHYLLIVKGL